MRALTDREINLLVFLAVFIIAVAFLTLVLLPAMEAQEVFKTTLEMDQLDHDSIQAQIAAYDGNVALADELAKDYAVYCKDMYPYMQSQEVDRLITNIVLQNGLDAKDLVMEGTAEPVIVQPYYLSNLVAAESGEIYMCRSSQRVEGTEAALWQLIDLFTNDLPSIRVTEFTWSDKTASQTEGEAQKTLNFTVEVYMYGETAND